MTRTPWLDGFPPAYAHTAWRSADGLGLGEHPLYPAAKGQRDAYAASEVIYAVAQEPPLEALYDHVFDAGMDSPLVVAPSAELSETNNALAITYAHWLARELGWEVDRRIFQTKKVSRDFQRGWFRLAHRSEFDGAVESGRAYVIADDVLTMGGTVADLRGFIESKGGHVIAVTVLATGDVNAAPLALDKATEETLCTRYGARFEADEGGLLGFLPSCFTEPEGRFLLRTCTSYDQVRTGILQARDAGGPRRGGRRRFPPFSKIQSR